MKETLDIAANMIKAGEIARGKAILESLLRTESDNVLALLWMTRCVSSPEEKLTYFRRVLEIDPSNEFALQGIGIFQPRCPRRVRTLSVGAPAPAPPPPTASPPSSTAPVPAPPPPTASAPGLAPKHKGLLLLVALALAAIVFTALCVALPLIIVGSEGSSQSAVAPQQPGVPEESYVDAMTRLSRDLADSWQTSSALMDENATLFSSSPSWVADMEGEVEARATACFRLGQLDPPSEFAASHAELMAGCADGETADDLLMYAIHNIDVDALSRSAGYMRQSSAHTQRASELLP